MPEATVTAIIVSNGHILLTRRSNDPFKGYWCLPGGHIDPNETAEEAVVREVKEETGLDLIPKFLGYCDEIFPDIGFHHVVLAFSGSVSGDLNIEPKEVVEAEWFNYEDVLEQDLAFDHSRVIEMFFQSKTVA